MNNNHENHDNEAGEYGNFYEYYQFNLVSERLNLIMTHKSLFDNPEITSYLDIGSNEGDLTIAIHNFLNKINITKTDAIEKDINLYNRSLLKNNEINWYNNDIFDYFKNKKKQYDLISIFSITMWIHLYYNDSGLNIFLDYIIKYCNKYILIEPHLWKSYKSCQKRRKSQKKDKLPLYYQIKIRNNVDQYIINYIINHGGFKLIQILGTTKWGRTLYLLEKKNKKKKIVNNQIINIYFFFL